MHNFKGPRSSLRQVRSLWRGSLKRSTQRLRSLLLLLSGRRTGARLRQRADLVAVPAAGLLQRPQLAGRAIEKARYRLPHAGQCVCRDRRLGPGPAHRGWMAGQAERFCPIFRDFGVAYHWSLDQCEYATDIVFRRQAELQAIYGNLTRTAIHTVKPDNIATFLGKKLVPQFQGEMGNRFNIRIEGTRIKHTMGPVSLKLYDKFGLILRIETTVNDVSFFRHYRKVEHRDGTSETKWAPMLKTVYS